MTYEADWVPGTELDIYLRSRGAGGWRLHTALSLVTDHRPWFCLVWEKAA